MKWTAILTLAITFGVSWSNHFESGFHYHDDQAIVENPAIQHLSGVTRALSDPRTSSTLPEQAAYRPVVTALFALDYWLARGLSVQLFQYQAFLWFVFQLMLMYTFFRLIPGGTFESALFATALYGLHPIATETLNYASQRGRIVGATALFGALALWIFWPQRLTQELVFDRRRIPTNWREELIYERARQLQEAYQKALRITRDLYFLPILIGLLAEPATVVFAPLIAVYTSMFEREPDVRGNGLRRALPPAIVCGGYWLVQFFFTWRITGQYQLPGLVYWSAQPWVTLRYLYAFFVPTGLSVESGLQPFEHPWAPLALIGYAGIALYIYLAVWLGKREEWRAVAFGLWWFLIALAPSALVPGPVVESYPRMFVAYAGLALALTRAVWILAGRIAALPALSNMGNITVLSGVLLAAALLIVSGSATYQRNEVWRSEDSLWSDAIGKNPSNGTALMHYARIRRQIDEEGGDDYLRRASKAAPKDPEIEIQLALAGQRLNRDAGVEAHYKRAIAVAPTWSRGYSAYGRWLLDNHRVPEAVAMAQKAAAMEPSDLVARYILMDFEALRHNWATLLRLGRETLRINPFDTDGQRAVLVAQDGIDEVTRAEARAKRTATVDDYLGLSVVYYRNSRFMDCIDAARRALRINQNLPEAHANIANAWMALGKKDDAIPEFQAALKLNPTLPGVKQALDALQAPPAAPAPKAR